MAVEGKMTEERNGKAEDPALDAQPDPNKPAEGTQTATDAGQQDDDDGDINAAFERVKEQLAEEKRQREAAEAGRRTAEEQGRRYQQEVEQGHLSVRQANLMAVDRALEANASSMQSLRSQYAAALQEGDYAKAAEVQSSLSEQAARKVQLEAGKYQLEQMPEQQQRQQPQNTDPFEAQIERYTERTRQWIRQHPDVLRDQRTANLAIAAHHTAVAQGHTPDSDAYFDALETTLGFKQGPDQRPQQKRPTGAAPPSRNGSPSGRNSSSMTVRDMSPAMLEAAKVADISPEEYLKYYQEAVKSGEIPAVH